MHKHTLSALGANCFWQKPSHPPATFGHVDISPLSIHVAATRPELRSTRPASTIWHSLCLQGENGVLSKDRPLEHLDLSVICDAWGRVGSNVWQILLSLCSTWIWCWLVLQKSESPYVLGNPWCMDVFEGHMCRPSLCQRHSFVFFLFCFSDVVVSVSGALGSKVHRKKLHPISS